MNIVVLCAGSSTEREVSIVTGTQVCKALREKGHNARVLDVFFGDKNRETFFDGGYDLEAACALIQSLSYGKLPSGNAGNQLFWRSGYCFPV